MLCLDNSLRELISKLTTEVLAPTLLYINTKLCTFAATKPDVL